VSSNRGYSVVKFEQILIVPQHTIYYLVLVGINDLFAAYSINAYVISAYAYVISIAKIK